MKRLFLDSRGRTTLVTLGSEKAIVILVNYNIKKLNDSSLPTCLRE
jgi:hypothetical protein